MRVAISDEGWRRRVQRASDRVAFVAALVLGFAGPVWACYPPPPPRGPVAPRSPAAAPTLPKRPAQRPPGAAPAKRPTTQVPAALPRPTIQVPGALPLPVIAAPAWHPPMLPA